ncbi:4-coumarate-CoA ligase-like protein [Apiospora hydei]|uniref:4-coumarate-CoA ligase-like protein n=1 Tax=Apiospora hydei TaxID=1337664 RepID=A0ABR1WP07_9PEZI
MASVVEKTAQGTIYKAHRTLTVPSVDILTLLFESEECYSPDTKVLHADADEPSNCLTKGQVLVQFKRVARVLRDQYGVGTQGPSRDVVFNVSGGHFMLPLIFYATSAAEGIFSSTSPSATPEELAYQLKETTPKVIICNDDSKANAIAAAKLVGFPRAISSATAGRSTSNCTKPPTTPRSPSRTRSLTGGASPIGTTGLPKAMKLSHQNLVAESSLVLEPIKEYNAKYRGPEYEYIGIAHLPVAHIAGVMGYLINCVYMRGTIFWMKKFDFAKFCEYSKKYKMTTGFSVPPIYLLITKLPNVTDQFDTWVDAITGAAPMGEELQVAVGKKLGKGTTRLRQTWGLSETTGSITVVPLETEHWRPGTVGSLVANHSARLVDDDGHDVELGKEGEILVKGPVVIKGYWNNPKADAEAFKDDWFYTGDIGVFRDGWLYILTLVQELIKYKGTQVAPAELEALLLTHPKIQDVAVIGVEGNGTELPRAYVVADPNKVSEEEIKAFVAKQVAPYKQLRGGVIYLPAIPKSPSGKILRKELRAMAKKESQTSKL